MDIQEGSYGGRSGKDGLDAVDTLYANTRNNPIEDIESHFPLRVTQYELLEDRGGPRPLARRPRHDAGDRVPRRRRLLARGRRLGRAAARALRRGGRHAGRGRCSTAGPTASVELPSKFPYRKAAAGRPALPDLAVRRRLRRPARARPRRGAGGPDRRIREPGVGSNALRTGGATNEETGLDPRRRDRGGGGGDRGRVAAGNGSITGAQANLTKHKAVPKFVAPGPGVRREGKAGGKTIFIIPASSQVPFVSTIANHIKRIATPVGVKVTIWQNQGQPSQWVQGMNAAIAQKRERDRPARRQRPRRPAAADQGREGEGHPDDRRAPLRPQPAVRAERRRLSSTSRTRSPAS